MEYARVAVALSKADAAALSSVFQSFVNPDVQLAPATPIHVLPPPLRDGLDTAPMASSRSLLLCNVRFEVSSSSFHFLLQF